MLQYIFKYQPGNERMDNNRRRVIKIKVLRQQSTEIQVSIYEYTLVRYTKMKHIASIEQISSELKTSMLDNK